MSRNRRGHYSSGQLSLVETRARKKRQHEKRLAYFARRKQNRIKTV